MHVSLFGSKTGQATFSYHEPIAQLIPFCNLAGVGVEEDSQDDSKYDDSQDYPELPAQPHGLLRFPAKALEGLPGQPPGEPITLRRRSYVRSIVRDTSISRFSVASIGHRYCECELFLACLAPTPMQSGHYMLKSQITICEPRSGARLKPRTAFCELL